MDERHSWASPEYVAEWIGQDVIEDVLRLPRSISVGLVADDDLAVERVIDLGAGPGAYLEAFLTAFPAAEGVWIDASEPMEEAARTRLASFGDRVVFRQADASRPDALDLPPAQVITTSRMVHHFPADAIERLYRTVHDALTPGGWFFNLDHLGSPDGWEPRYRRVRSQLIARSRDPKDRHAHDHPFHPVSDHLAWLRSAGFATPDVAWKTFFSALLVGRREH
ncbi:MAG: class I SAM-dependent methyltransferase [Actinobacteria bacterium]|nr:class I SAM-dependent methyltransferase [Actinomycetota bacterium]